jgi:hypothetical protein
MNVANAVRTPGRSEIFGPSERPLLGMRTDEAFRPAHRAHGDFPASVSPGSSGDDRQGLSSVERAGAVAVVVLVALLGVIGAVNSFAAVAAAVEPSFGRLAWTVPFGIDVGIAGVHRVGPAAGSGGDADAAPSAGPVVPGRGDRVSQRGGRASSDRRRGPRRGAVAVGDRGRVRWPCGTRVGGARRAGRRGARPAARSCSVVPVAAGASVHVAVVAADGAVGDTELRGGSAPRA